VRYALMTSRKMMEGGHAGARFSVRHQEIPLYFFEGRNSGDRHRPGELTSDAVVSPTTTLACSARG
jgi:hypothetical protein